MARAFLIVMDSVGCGGAPDAADFGDEGANTLGHIAAACAEGRTVLRGAQELRVKESDRLQVMDDGLEALGVKCEPTPDGIIIEGGLMGGGEVHAHGDHRIAMAFSVASLRAAAPIRIHDCANVATSFPNFLTLCAQVGIRVAQEAQL